MILSEAERERKINDFLTRKLKQFDLEEDVPAIHGTGKLQTKSPRA